MTRAGYGDMVARRRGHHGGARRHAAQGRAVPPRHRRARRAPAPRRPCCAACRAGEPNCTIFSMPVPDGTFFGATPRAPRRPPRRPGGLPPAGRDRRPRRHGAPRRRRPARPGPRRPRTARSTATSSRRSPPPWRRCCDELVRARRALARRLPLGGPPRHADRRACWPARAGVLELLGRLHPTPAVGGTPRADALAFIDAARGRRAGLLGRAGRLGRTPAATASG